MTDIKKSAKGKKSKKSKKLQLNKETIKDLNAKDSKEVKGGVGTGPAAAMSRVDLCCWVARAVYGESNPRWLIFRQWLLVDAPPWFRGLYLWHGERVARWIAPHAAVKSVIRLWMNSIIDRKHSADNDLLSF